MSDSPRLQIRLAWNALPGLSLKITSATAGDGCSLHSRGWKKDSYFQHTFASPALIFRVVSVGLSLYNLNVNIPRLFNGPLPICSYLSSCSFNPFLFSFPPSISKGCLLTGHFQWWFPRCGGLVGPIRGCRVLYNELLWKDRDLKPVELLHPPGAERRGIPPRQSRASTSV